LKLKMNYVSSKVFLNSKYLILNLRQVKGGIYVFQEFFRGEDFDSIARGPTISRHKSLSLGDSSFDCQC
jgi:hypothetical protein